MNLVTGQKLQFYRDQCSARECRQSELIDTEYEQEQERKHLELAENTEREKEEHDFVIDEIEIEEMSDDDFMNSTKVNDSLSGINSSNSLSLDISATRSGNVFIKKVKVECSTQTEACKAERPKLRINKKQSADAIKSTCSKLSSICAVSLETTCKVVQVVYKDVYDHNIYLTPEEQLEGKQEIFNQEKH